MATAPDIQPVALHEATRHRYLNYAMSVITARALPDVRDGLKPVQRRILYAMDRNLRLRPDARYRKSAAVVGEVMAKYHPHGDQSIYDALVRMAQPFSLLHTLVDGQGNFGALDGDGAAAMRYTECKLTKLAMELLSELGQQTVDFRPNYDGQHQEPEVLPAQFPQMLVNGAEGIAVGMATRIPPHNLREVIDACVVLIDDPEATLDTLLKKVKGPDLPTGGRIVASASTIREIYENGRGSVKVQAVWTTEKKGRKELLVITETPWGITKGSLVEKIGALVGARKLPQVVDVRDESSDEVRIVLELRKPGDAPAAMAFLLKHSPLELGLHVNLTCLLPPTEPGGVCTPVQASLDLILRKWLDFRYATVRRRFEYELQKLRDRIHILEGFAIVFADLDAAIRIIRASEGKRDAAERLMDHFDLDDVQVEKILDLQLYRLSRLPISEILEELEEKREAAARIEAILASNRELWGVVRRELLDIRSMYGKPRQTRIGTDADAPAVIFDESAYIVAEDTFVVVTREGWIKRQASFTSIDRIRIREGDAVGWFLLASTRATITFFSNKGGAYVMRTDDVPATTGYGEPIQKHFRFSDGERVVGVSTSDPRGRPAAPDPDPEVDAAEAAPHGVALTRTGRIIRFSLSGHVEISQRGGRRFARLATGDQVLRVIPSIGTEWASIATRGGNALAFPVSEVSVLKGPGKGVTGIKLKAGDSVVAYDLVTGERSGVTVQTTRGRDVVVSPKKYGGSRAGRGQAVIQRGGFQDWAPTIERLDLQFATGEE